MISLFSHAMTPDLSIIIVNWNSKAFVRRCLQSLRDNVRALKLEVLVIDNASFDGCDAMLSTEFPETVFLQSERNVGFAVANDVAFHRSRGRYVLFLNPDTEILGDAVERLVSGLVARPHAGLVGAHLLNSDRTTQTTCITAVPTILNQTLNSEYLRRLFPRWKIWGMRALFANDQQPSPVEAISGACMLARRKVLEQVGAFSTEYFMYAEDMDLCVKIVKAGWTIYYIPEAFIVHHAGGSSVSRSENNFSNIVLRQSLVQFLKVHRGTRYSALYRASIIVIALLRILLLLIASPVLLLRRNEPFLRRALSKWSSILVWSLGFRDSALVHSRP